jgi:ATP-dependent DNA helicase RecQ
MNIHAALNKYFGYSSFRTGQEEIITSIIDGKNVVAILPTGGGKSLCFQIPALLSQRYSIVISPLIALMKDQVDSLNRLGQSASFINSSLDYSTIEKVLHDVQNNKVKLLYVSPEKLENASFTEKIKNYPPEYLFVDEAHCISEWGHNFRTSYRRIINFIKYTGIKKISAFTATATKEVRTDIIKQLELENVEVFVKGFERNNISLNVIKTKKKKEKTYELIKQKKAPAIIYASTRENCEEIAFYLNSHGLNAAYYHAGITTELRKLIQDDFIENRIDIIAATNAFGMGIDKQNIHLIIHYNMPGSIENYYQEFGRAGRDGEEADVFLLYDRKDEDIQRYFINNSYPSLDTITEVYDLICDYAHLALGNTYSHRIQLDQNFSGLISQKGISKAQLDNALSILESSGYFKRNSEYDKGYLVQIALPQQRLESYLKSFAMNQLRDLLFILLRQQGAQILTNKVKINITKASEELNLDKKDISDLLDELANSGIILYEKPSNFPSVSLQCPRVKSGELNLDINKFENLTKHLNGKLESMIGYVNSEVCRSRVILNYFGEEAGNHKCGKCDICTGSDSSDRISLEFFQEKVLETIHESDGNVRLNILVDILKGKEKKRDYTVYSNFGCAKHFSKEQIENTIQNLISKHAVAQINGMLSITEKGKNFFALDNKTIKPLNSDYEDKLKLYNLLRNARKEASQKFSQPINLICTDDLLRKISEIKPTTVSALNSIEGFNQRMFNKVGEEFLQIIKESLNEKKQPPVSNIDSRFNLKELISKKYKLEEIVSLIKSSEAVVSIQIESLIEYDISIEINSLFGKNELQMINSKIKEGFKSLKELKQELPSSISYGKIRIALAATKSN